MRLIDADELPEVNTIERIEGDREVFVNSWIPASAIWKAPTVDAIPITDLYRMISNVQLDCDDDSEFSSEYFDGYGDGTRNAIVEMVQALCGDRDGDCVGFWKRYLSWEKENEID